MTLKISAGRKNANDKNIVLLDGEKDSVRLVRVTIKAGAHILSRKTDAWKLRQQFKPAFEAKMIFEGLIQAELPKSVLDDEFDIEAAESLKLGFGMPGRNLGPDVVHAEFAGPGVDAALNGGA